MNGTPRDQMLDAFGAYVRSQRQLARLTLRQAAELASISNPYLSQIEHGLARPSITVVSALAEALSVSAETLLLMAAGLGAPSPTGPAGRSSDTEASIRQDPRLGDRQKHALLAVLASFVDPPSVPPEPSTSRKPVSTSRRPAGTSGEPAAAGSRQASRKKVTP